jgi:hypothetical protein
MEGVRQILAAFLTLINIISSIDRCLQAEIINF